MLRVHASSTTRHGHPALPRFSEAGSSESPRSLPAPAVRAVLWDGGAPGTTDPGACLHQSGSCPKQGLREACGSVQGHLCFLHSTVSALSFVNAQARWLWPLPVSKENSSETDFLTFPSRMLHSFKKQRKSFLEKLQGLCSHTQPPV